jgi:predicted thioredoxin/glutaredoxin
VAVLQVFVEARCAVCRRSLEIVRDVREWFPALRVEVIDLASPDAHRPEQVFSVPTFVLDGHLLSLGNPRPATLMRALRAYLALPQQERNDDEAP